VSAEVRTTPKKARRPQERSLALRQAILDVAEEYERMTVRQLFYQLVSRGAVEKTEQAYKLVCYQSAQLRLGGELAYGKIADGHRSRRRTLLWDDAQERLESVRSYYRKDYWLSQPLNVEVWCEKDALTGIIEPICGEYGVTYVATRGFPSLTLLWESAQAMQEKRTLIFYFGDHDASGHGISDGIEPRLLGFGALVEVHRVALGLEQVRKYRLPTRPGKATDSRHAGFRRRFGSSASVELDALDPKELERMVRESVESCIEWSEWGRMQEIERLERETLAKVRLPRRRDG
jgi:hypothetical protein